MIIQSFPGADPQQAWQALWYRATTLAERSTSLLLNEALPPLTEEQLALAKQHLEEWKQQAIFQDPEILKARLEIDRLSEDDLLVLLGESAESVYQRFDRQPRWLHDLLQVLEEHKASVSSLEPQAKNAQPTLFDAFRPLLLPALTGLSRTLREVAQTEGERGKLPCDPTTFLRLVQGHLMARIKQASARALVLEMHVARLQGYLSGETPQERYNSFLNRLCQPEHLRAFLQEYAVLARAVITISQQWEQCSLELFQRLCTDWQELRSALAGEQEPGALVEVQWGAGDTHRNGHSVVILCFQSGLKIVYKPRSLALDQHFQQVLAWINEQGATPPLYTLKIVQKGSYGWSEFVQAQDCGSEEEVSRFYERQGCYLALFFALAATDFHHDNLLAAGEHPIFFDLEALFHPRFGEDKEDEIAQSISHSVLWIGLLPRRLQNEEGEGIDNSGLGSLEGQLTTRPVMVWKGSGTDEMHIERERLKLRGNQNRPKLAGQHVDILKYEPALLQGFQEMYRLLMTHREELLTEILPHFAQDEIRLILRGTATYTQLQQESYHPERLRDALEAEKVFNHLWNPVRYQRYLKQVIPFEHLDLAQGDIPIFTTQPASRDLLTSQGERLSNFCAKSGFSFAQQRIMQMSEEDLARQQWIIRASLATTIMETSQMRQLTLRKPAYQEIGADRLMSEACALGDRLEERALSQGRGVNWLGVKLHKEFQTKGIWALQAMDPLKLYDGSPGIVLFLSYLGALSGEVRYTNLARKALATVQHNLERLLSGRIAQRYIIGAFSGLGSLIYLYTHLAALWQESSYLYTAQEVVSRLPKLVEQDEQYDIISGAAGCILALLSLYHVAPEDATLQVAIHCGEHLLAHAQPMDEGLGWYTLKGERALAGFSHGAAGISFSLLQLAQVSRQDRFRRAALASIVYERTLFSPEQNNWARLMEERKREYSFSWCHGAPGIGLARLASLPYLDDNSIRSEITSALHSTLKRGFGHNQSLCHGDLGNLETILTATQMLTEPQYHEALKRLTALVYSGIAEHGWVTGVPMGVETPGLMTGLAGIGYQLLRLAAPHQVPAVLLLAPPGTTSVPA